MKTLVWKDTCTPVFITALFTIAKIWKQTKWLSTDEYEEDVTRWYIMYNEILLDDKPVFILKQYVIWSCWIWTLYKWNCILCMLLWFDSFGLGYTQKSSESRWSCPTLCSPIDYTGHGILQARILEWVAIPFSRGSSQPRDRTQVSRIAGGFFTSWVRRDWLRGKLGLVLMGGAMLSKL